MLSRLSRASTRMGCSTSPARRLLPGLLGACLCMLALLGAALPAWAVADSANEVYATVQKSPPQITLNWRYGTDYANAATVTIMRKLFDAPTWNALATVPGTQTSYPDTDVVVGQRYEYRIRITGMWTNIYLCAGIEATAEEDRGKLILFVDETVKDALTLELRRLVQDLAGDGWTVIRYDVPRHDFAQATTQPESIKDLIKAQYNADPDHMKAVFLFGHAPVPYSGDTAPDGHSEHAGAWPADTYYGDMDGTWTDTQNFNYGSGRPNVAGDGFFDQMYLPNALKLQVGRVDLFDMPEFAPRDEVQLLRDYLNKDHAFRMKRKTVMNAGAAMSAYYLKNDCWNLTSLCSTVDGNGDALGRFIWFYPPADPYLWITINGLGTRTGQYSPGIDGPAIMPRSCPAEFTLLYGSFYGQWDYQDDFMRAVLGAPENGLTSMWGVGSSYTLHRMGMGGSIGDTFRASVSGAPYDYSSYDPTMPTNMVLTNLMGDPSLRQNYVAPPTAVTVQANAGQVKVNWTASAEPVQGYFVYRGAAITGPFTRITPALLAGTSFTDANPDAGKPIYLVRAEALTTTPSGTFWNLSQGAFATTAAAPVAEPQTLAVDENTPLTCTLTGTLANGSTPFYSIVTPPAHGTLTGTAPNLTYTPSANYAGDDFLTFEINDGVATSAPAVISITVNAINHAPVVTDQAVLAPVNTPFTFNLQASDVDANTTLTCQTLTAPAHGSVSFAGVTATYTPVNGYLGDDFFTYKVSDGNAEARATVSINVSTPAMPMSGLDLWLKADSLGLGNDAQIITWGDSSGNNHNAYASFSDPRASSLQRFQYPTLKASATSNGLPSVKFISDNQAFSYTTKMAIPDIAVGKRNTMIVVAKENSPNMDRQYIIGSLATQANQEWGLLTFTDSNNSAFPTFVGPGTGWTADTAVGALGPDFRRIGVVCADAGTTLNLDNTAKKTAAALNDNLGALALGWSSYVYRPDGLDGEIAEVLVYNRVLSASELTQVDDYLKAKYTDAITPLPVAMADTATTTQGTPVTISTLANDTPSTGGDTLVVDSVTTPLYGGTVENNGNSIRYTPAPGYVGTDSFTYKVKDTTTGITSPFPATVVVTVQNGPLTGVTLSSFPVAPRPVRTAITLTAMLAGGFDVECKFSAGYQDSSGWHWSDLCAYSSSRTCTWTPTDAHLYTLAVWVREKGSAQSYEVLGTQSYRITAIPLTGVVLAATPTTPQPINTPITLTATPIGGTLVEYQFRGGYQDATGWHWSVLRDYSATASCAWTPVAARTYTLLVYAREQSSVKTYDVYTSQRYVARLALSGVSLAAAPASPQRANTLVTLTATPLGGSAEYQFRVGYQDVLGWHWQALQGYNTTRSCT